jgi:menaquinol-cytochrome c reductase iron-sulfur subunit
LCRRLLGEGITAMASIETPDEGEMTRRGFVGWAVGFGAAFVALVGGVPLVGALVGHTAVAKAGAFVQVADVKDLPAGEPFGVTFVNQTQDGYTFAALPHSVWAVKRSDTDVVVFSPVCTHLGCQVFFDRTAKQFVCPCHASVFALDGSVVSGPAPRPLDTLPTRIKSGALFVQWVDYAPGMAVKTPV